METCPYFIVGVEEVDEAEEAPSTDWPMWLFAGSGGYVLLGPVGVAGVGAAWYWSMANAGLGA